MLLYSIYFYSMNLYQPAFAAPFPTLLQGLSSCQAENHVLILLLLIRKEISHAHTQKIYQLLRAV